jgi:hypothetical protein
MNFAVAIARGASITATLGWEELGAVFAGIFDGAALGTRMADHFSESEVADHELVQQRARTVLGDAAYDAATARGAALGADEVVAYTLGVLDRLLAELDDA